MQKDCILNISFFGASHEKEVGVLIEGVPAGLELCAEDFAADIARRAAGAPGTTPRREQDVPLFVSGGTFSGDVFITDGTPLRISFENRDIDDAAYSQFNATPRPGHADWVALRTVGSVPPGGGRASGRMTLPMVASGVVAKKLLPSFRFSARVVEIGGCPDSGQWNAIIMDAMHDGDSLGGIVECVISGSTAATPAADLAAGASGVAATPVSGGVPIGLGGDFFDSVESRISQAMFAIPGVRGVEFGDGFRAASMKGSGHNDPIGPDGPLKNGSGGVNGGRTNGAPIVFRVAFKPTSSIGKIQRTWDFSKGRFTDLSVGGRHDCCFALRTPAVVEALAAIVIYNLCQSKQDPESPLLSSNK